MNEGVNRQFYLHRRPTGRPTAEEVRRRDAPVPQPAEGQLLVRNYYLSLDPAIRGWMSAEPSYLPPIALGDPIRATTVGEVVESRHPDFAPGEFVVGLHAWEDYSLSDGTFLMKVPADGKYPLHYYLSILGAVGLTPYFAITETAEIRRPGETLLMSAAAGAVGSVGGQIAKILGCRVVGIAGSDEKCAWITEELGFDAAINYKTCGDLVKAIADACPEGVDIYFDNVGGAILDAALLNMVHGGRIVFCGAISAYNGDGKVPGPLNWWQVLARALTVRGYLVSDFFPRWPEGIAQMSRWLDEGRIRFREEIHRGFENTLEVFLELFDGANTGKLIMDIRED
ncbi:MAG: NADP-dependent oxidoreductase [Porticoccaceae bacterium]|nr:MAG: NADP-dependent oxidoreductase [Porticoccaceae bacterium]